MKPPASSLVEFELPTAGAYTLYTAKTNEDIRHTLLHNIWLRKL
jgi:hypothetical protein